MINKMLNQIQSLKKNKKIHKKKTQKNTMITPS